MWTKLPPPDFENVDNQIDMCLLGRCALTWGNVSSLGVTRSHLGGNAISPGGDASPRRHCQVGARCPNLAIQYNDESGTRFVFACQGIEPCQANADAGTRRPQVRLRPPQAYSLYNVIQHTFILNLCTCFLHLLYNVYICDLKSFFKINLRTLWNFTILFS